MLEKRKRISTSGSRSKSKKAKQPKQEITVQLKPKPLHIFHNHDICAKVKTQNSISLNKSKPNRKNSKSVKKPILNKPNFKDSKDSKDQSYLVSAQRKFSVNKINKTESTHIQNEDIFKKLYSVKKHLLKIQSPKSCTIKEIQKYYNQIKSYLETVSLQPLNLIFQLLHSMYVVPTEEFFNHIRPYENLLRKKQQLTKQINNQIQQNQNLFKQLQPEDLEIIKLKHQIQKNAQLIQEAKKKKKLINYSNQKQNQKLKSISMKKKKDNQENSFYEQQISVNNVSNKVQHQMRLINEYEKGNSFLGEDRRNNYFLANKSFQKKVQKRLSVSNQSYESQDIKNKSISQVQKSQNLYESQQQNYQSSYNQVNATNKDEVEQNQNGALSEDDIPEQNKAPPVKMGLSFNFKLDIPKIDKSNVGFHDEFYSKLDEFSQSWRNQALREKRF